MAKIIQIASIQETDGAYAQLLALDDEGNVHTFIGRYPGDWQPSSYSPISLEKK